MPIRTIEKCDRTDTSQKQLDGYYQGRQEAMDHEKQAGAKTLAGVIEVVNYTFEISETRGVRRAGTGTAQKKTGCIVWEKMSTMSGCDVDGE